GERALHAARGMTGNGALVGVLALLDRHGERRALAVTEHRRLLAGDLEIVLESTGVRHLERDLAGLRLLGRELEAEVERRHLDGRRLRLARRTEDGRSGESNSNRDRSEHDREPTNCHQKASTERSYDPCAHKVSAICISHL